MRFNSMCTLFVGATTPCKQLRLFPAALLSGLACEKWGAGSYCLLFQHVPHVDAERPQPGKRMRIPAASLSYPQNSCKHLPSAPALVQSL